MNRTVRNAILALSIHSTALKVRFRALEEQAAEACETNSSKKSAVHRNGHRKKHWEK